MKIREDILGRKPMIGDIIVFNPPRYKGIISSSVLGFSKAGLPMVKPKKGFKGDINKEGLVTPKTGFVVVRSHKMTDEDIRTLKSTICLLSSMISSGEQHTETSQSEVTNALNILKTEQGWHELMDCGLDEKLKDW